MGFDPGPVNVSRADLSAVGQEIGVNAAGGIKVLLAGWSVRDA